MMRILKNLSFLSLRVWQRNVKVYAKTWKTNLIPPFLEPIFYLLAFGAGIGALVKHVTYHGEQISYQAFIAPGMLATQVMFQAFFENTYATFVRMYYQKTFDAIIATPLTLEDVVLGELLWGMTRSVIGCVLMLLAITSFGLVKYPEVLLIIPFSFLAGLFFASIGMLITSFTPQIDFFNFPHFLFIMPMFLFSGTFFPLEVMPAWAQHMAEILPLTHVVNVMRQASLGTWSPRIVVDLGYLLALTPPLLLLSIYFMKRRLVK